MKPRKPDRFERIVDTHRRHDDWGIDVVSAADTIKLLRKEHAWVRRMVQGEMVSGETGTEGDIAYNRACLDILKQLEQRRK